MDQLEQWFPNNTLYDYGELSGILPQYIYAVLKLKQHGYIPTAVN